MKFGAVFICFASLSLIAHGQRVEITSPDHAYTFAYGTAFSHQVDRDQLTDQLIARVTFSNYPYATDRQPRFDETFDFVSARAALRSTTTNIFLSVTRESIDSRR
jgi:hypothetical protein